MAEPVPYCIMTPDGVAAQGEAVMIVVPSANGDMGVMLRHSPMIVQLRRGSVAIFSEGQKVSTRFYVDGGTAHITPESLTILSDSALAVDKIDIAEATATLQAASATTDSDAVERAQAQLLAAQQPVYA